MNRPNRGRRKRDEPFNPFAKNAIQERNRRQAERAKEQRLKDNLASQTSKPESNNASAKIRSLEEMRKAAQQKLATDTIVDQKLSTESESKSESSSPELTPVITNSVAVENAPVTPKISREDRLAELKRKSEESKKKAKLQEHVKPDVTETVEVNDSELIQTDLDDSIPLVDSDDGDKLNPSSLVDKKSKNVFKTVTTQKNNAGYSSSKKRKTRRIDKKGGGRQKLEKKLNRQKILEFKYVARDILDNPEVPEEHRSNVLGQIIAKGERISIDSAIEFIDQKCLELILTESVANELKNEIKSISTRR